MSSFLLPTLSMIVECGLLQQSVVFSRKSKVLAMKLQLHVLLGYVTGENKYEHSHLVDLHGEWK